MRIYTYSMDHGLCTTYRCCKLLTNCSTIHYNDVIMTTIASQITSLTVVYSTVYSDADQRKHQSSVSLALCVGNSPGPVNSPHKGPVTRKMFPFDAVIMWYTKAPPPLDKWQMASDSVASRLVISCSLDQNNRLFLETDAICRHKSWSTLAQVMACCLTSPSHQRN